MNEIKSLFFWKGDMVNTINLKRMLSAAKDNKAREGEDGSGLYTE